MRPAGGALPSVVPASSGRDQRPDAFHTEGLIILEIDADERVAARIVFDLDDIDAAFKELDARYVASEAAQYSHTWSVIAGVYAAFNRRELPATTPDWVNIDHRRGTGFAPGEAIPYVRAAWDVAPDINIYIEAVHRLSSLGSVVTYAANGTSGEGFHAEWREITILTFEGDLISRCEIFEEADIDAALARFDELDRPTPRLENLASQADKRFTSHLVARDWDAMAEMVADDMRNDDRRRLVGAGVRVGRDAEIENVRAITDIGVHKVTSDVIAIRGERLALSRYSLHRDERPEAFRTDMLGIVEIDDPQRIKARTWFELDDIDAAFAELDARYLAGEAATHAHTWSVIERAFAASNRHETFSTTPGWANIDHRRVTSFGPGELNAYIRASWDDMPDGRIFVEAVHRLSNLGVVITYRAKGTTREGFEAEWRGIAIMMVDGDSINRGEMFDEEDLDAALARFEELSRPTQRLENAASQVGERFLAQFAARDWDAMAEILADDFSSDDRRRVVGAGVRRGRDAEIADMRAISGLGLTNARRTAVLATRGGRLVLSRVRFSGGEHGPEAVVTDILGIVETDADNRIAATVVFDPDDVGVAIAELDARYLAGEAAAHAQTWSLVAEAYAAFNRRELPATTPDWVNIDHRRGIGFAPGDTIAVHPCRVGRRARHQHLDRGRASAEQSRSGRDPRVKGASQQGFDAEWREIDLLTVEARLINRCEIFDEADLDVALSRFDELSRPAPSLENTATRTWARIADAFNRRDMEGALALTAADGRYEDRRKGLRDKGTARDVWETVFDAPKGWRLAMEPVATRGPRLGLTRGRFRDTDYADRPITVEYLTVTGVSDDDRLDDIMIFDLDDIDTAFEELDARYLAGEAGAHARTWSVVKEACAAINRRELPVTTPDWVNIDHRRGAGFAPGDAIPYIRAMWDVMSHIEGYIEAVHRLTNLGAVVTRVSKGTSQEGFDAEWREIDVATIEGDLINRCEVFDEADLDAALTRFDELNRPAAQLANAATQVLARMMDAFNRRDLDSFLSFVSADGRYEDRRKGLRDQGPIKPHFARALFFEAAPSWQEEVEPIAIRGARLVLYRLIFRDHSEVDRPITVEALVLTQVTDDELAYYIVIFDPDDINGAMAELTARWIASGEVAHPEVIEAGRQLSEAYNRHDWDAVATHEAGATYVNHRQLATVDPEAIADHWLSIRTLASLIPDLWIEGAEILTHSAAGLVTNMVVKGTTTDGVAIELPALTVVLFDGGRLKHMEAFDLHQRELALARFEELNRPT